MPPKKAKKIALSEFLGDSALGSWADEMEELPNAPAPKLEEDTGRSSDRGFGRGGDHMPRAERPGFAREEIPLPTGPPYTAFVGNLAFDILEEDITNHFSDLKINTVKIIKDKDDRPKGFGYVEFGSLEDLKEAIAKSGSSLSGRVVRVSVAEPPKERTGFGGGGHDDDSKFDNPWRRDGPLPDLPNQGGRRRFEPGTGGPERAPSVTDSVSDWRSSRPARAPPPPESDPSNFRRKGSGQFAESAADKEETWTSRFKPSEDAPSGPGSRFGAPRPRGEFGLGSKEPSGGEGDWRSNRPARPAFAAKSGGSPVDSTPPTPQRRKLELLPRSGPVSTSPSPVSSPKLSSQPAAPRSNPFGAAKPVDVTQREKEVESKIEREREALKEKEPRGHPMSRTTSRTASERGSAARVATPPPSQGRTPASPKPIPASLAANVRPTLSFANAAAKKGAKGEEGGEKAEGEA